MDYSPYKKKPNHLFSFRKKIFTPIVLYDSSTSKNHSTSHQNSHRQSLIEEHRQRTRNMLEYNAQLWENEGRSSFKISSSDQSPEQSVSPSFTSSESFVNQQIKSNHSNTSSKSFMDSPVSCNQQHVFGNNNKQSPPRSNTNILLEPETQTSIPLPLYNHELIIHTPDEASMTSYIPPSPPLPANNQQHHSNHQFFSNITKSEEDEDKEGFDGEEEEAAPMLGSNTHMTTTTFINEPQFHHTYKPHISRKRRRGNLPKQVTEFLKRWLILHKKHPYPTEREKQKLAHETGLMVNQISNWFINARRRILQPLLESENRLLQQVTGDNNNQESSSFSNPHPSSAGVNVVGGAGHGDYHMSRNYNNRMSNPMTESSDGGNNYQPHQHHHYNQNSHSSTSDLLLQQPSEDNQHTAEEGEELKYCSVAPPWVLLPTKLPFMNILEKDLDAFEPSEEQP